MFDVKLDIIIGTAQIYQINDLRRSVKSYKTEC